MRLALIALCLALAACQPSRQEFIAGMTERCQEYGLKPGTDAMGLCIQREMDNPDAAVDVRMKRWFGG